MLSPYWTEYARLQSLVEMGKAHDEQLDLFLKNQSLGNDRFDTYQSRRQSKNLGRNLKRKERSRSNLLKRNFDRVARKIAETPVESLLHGEQAEVVRQSAGKDWLVLRDTVDGDYESKSTELGIPVGTLKSRVSRAKAKMYQKLKPYMSA